MARVSNQPVKKSPFTTYRDPQTGKWIIEKCQENEKSN